MKGKYLELISLLNRSMTDRREAIRSPSFFSKRRSDGRRLASEQELALGKDLDGF
jgi:hypothetical protein